jgi:hypothetical protein
MAHIGKQFAVKGLNKSGEGLIQIYINFTRTCRKVISTGVYVEPKYWDSQKSTIIKHPLALKYNFLIDNMKLSILKLENDSKDLNIDFTAELIDDHLNTGIPFKVFNEYYKKELDNTVSDPGTYKDQLKTLQHFNSFNPKIRFLDLNLKLIKEFDKYLHDLGHAQVTINCHHKNIKKYINLSIKMGYYPIDISKHPYLGFKLPNTKSDRPFLSYEQIMAIYLAQYPTFRLRRVADRFVFACCTGIKVSDLSRVTPDKFDGKMLKMEPNKFTKTSGCAVIL